MRVGQLNRLLQLQKVTMTADSEGVSAEAWTSLGNVWAHIVPIGAKEVAEAGQTEERITHQITIRWRSDLTTKQRFLYSTPMGNRYFLIHSMLDQDEAHREVDCVCEEIVSVGVGST